MEHSTRRRWWFGLAGVAFAQALHSGCVYKEPLAIPPVERAAPPAMPPLPPIVVNGSDEEARYLAEVLASTRVFESVASEGGAEDPQALRVAALAVTRVRAVMVDQQPFLLLYMGVVPMWEAHDLGISFLIATAGRPKVTCSWPVEWWLGWPTLPLALLPSWSVSRDRDAFNYEMRRCVLAHRDLFIATAAAEESAGVSPLVRDVGGGEGEGECVLPTIEALLERSRSSIHDRAPSFLLPQADRVVTSGEGRILQWVAVTWDGPKDGAVFLLDCAGRTLALARLGAITEISPGPILPDVGPTVVVRYEPGVDTSRTVELVEILTARGRGVVRLWKHPAVESTFGVASTDGAQSTDDRYWWSFENDGAVLRVEGRRSILPAASGLDGEDAPATQDLPERKFCWNASTVGYEPCRDSPR